MAEESAGMAVPEEAYLEAIRDHEPYATSSKIADELGITRQGVDKRLRSMAEEGKVESVTVGNTIVWNIAE